MNQQRGSTGQDEAEPSPFGQERKNPLGILRSIDLKAWFGNFKLPSLKTANEGGVSGTRAFVFDEAMKTRTKKVVLWIVVVAFIATLTLSPLLVRVLMQTGNATPNWWVINGQQVITTDFRLTPANWPVMFANFWYFVPWMVWSLSVPGLLWVLKKERQEARESSDFWAVLFASMFFLAVRFYPIAFGAFGGQLSAWFTGATPHIWGTAEVVPAAAMLGAFVGLVVSLQGQRDMTPLSVILIIEAVIWKAFDPDMNWPRLFMTAGLLLAVYEVIKTPRGRGTSDRAGVFGMTVVSVLIFIVVRNFAFYLIRSNIESISSVPFWYTQVGQIIWQNANVIAIGLGIFIAWMGRAVMTRLMVQVVVKVVGASDDFKRLAPNPEYSRQWDSVLLFVASVLAVWLYFGSL